MSRSPCQSMNRSPAACSETARSDLLLSGAARLAAVRLESEKFDPAPAPAETSALVNSGKSAVYETTFGHPVETRSAAFIIRPIASRSGRSLPCSLTRARAGKLSIYFHGTCIRGAHRRLCEVKSQIRQPPRTRRYTKDQIPGFLRGTSCLNLVSFVVNFTHFADQPFPFSRSTVYHDAILETS